MQEESDGMIKQIVDYSRDVLFVVVVILLILTTVQATEVKEQVGPYVINLSTDLNTTAQNGTINDEEYILKINYTIPEGWQFGLIRIERYNGTLANLAKDFKSMITRLGYIPLAERYERIDGCEGVVVPYKSSTSLLPADFYEFGYWLNGKTLVWGWVSFEMDGPCWDTKASIASMESCFKSLEQLPRSLRTLHVSQLPAAEVGR